MYLFILESLGAQELILIGVIALIVFGPRKMPEMARKLGSMMSEFKKVSGEFRSTWEDAVDLEKFDEPKMVETAKHVDANDEFDNSIGKAEKNISNGEPDFPEVKNVSKEEFDEIVAKKSQADAEKVSIDSEEIKITEKTDWL